MSETFRRADSGRIHLAFMIDSELTKEALGAAVETARAAAREVDRDRIEYAPPIRVKAPLPSLAFASGGLCFAVNLIEQLMAGYKGATIVDLREPSVVISREPNLARQNISVVTRDGADHVRTAGLARDRLDRILVGLLSLPRSTGEEGLGKEDVAAIVKGATSDRQPGGTVAVA